MTLLDVWKVAHEMIITQHPLDQYIQRSVNRDGPPAYSIAELIRAEYVLGWHMGRHVEIRDNNTPRIAAGWVTEPLVSLVKVRTEEGFPVVLTVLTQRMYEESVKSGRYVVEKPGAAMPNFEVQRHAKEASDLKARLGEPLAWLQKIRQATGASSNAHALQLVKAKFTPLHHKGEACPQR